MDMEPDEDGTLYNEDIKEEGDVFKLYNLLLGGESIVMMFVSSRDLRSFRNSFASAKIRYDQQNIKEELFTEDEISTFSVSSVKTPPPDRMIKATLSFTPKGTRVGKKKLTFTILPRKKEQE